MLAAGREDLQKAVIFDPGSLEIFMLRGAVTHGAGSQSESIPSAARPADRCSYL
jgi:hypothetical protein